MRTVFLLALTAACFGQDFSKLAIEKVAGGFTFTEGPVWSRDSYLLFSDVPENKIWRLTSEGKSAYREASNGANGNTFDMQGRLYSCESRSRRVTRTDKKGAIEVLADKFEGKRLNAPNDIVVRKDGHVFSLIRLSALKPIPANSTSTASITSPRKGRWNSSPRQRAAPTVSPSPQMEGSFTSPIPTSELSASSTSPPMGKRRTDAR